MVFVPSAVRRIAETFRRKPGGAALPHLPCEAALSEWKEEIANDLDALAAECRKKNRAGEVPEGAVGFLAPRGSA